MGRLCRRMLRTRGTAVRMRAEAVEAERPLSRLSVRVENDTPCDNPVRLATRRCAAR